MTSEDVYLGLDISTSCTGWALTDKNGDPISIGWFDIAKIEGTHLKADEVERGLMALPKPTKVFVEDNVLGFTPGRSTAHTIITLAKFNAVVSYICWKLWGVPVVPIPSKKARSTVGLKIPKGENVKKYVLEWSMNKSDSKFWPTREIKSGKRKNEVVPMQGCFDAADAFLLVNAGLKIFT